MIGQGGVSPVPGGAQGHIPQWNGVYYGVVSNNADPQNNNRVLLRIPQILGSAVTTWAVSLTPQQAKPKVGTLVAALFIGGDLDYPAYYVVNPQLAIEGSAGNIKPVGTASAPGTSVKYAAADHVHGNICTSAATISTITQGAVAAAGASGQVADAAHVHAMTTLNYLPAGSGGFLEIDSSTAFGGDTQAYLRLESQGFAGQTTAAIGAALTTVSGAVNISGNTEITGILSVDSGNINIGTLGASLTPNNFNMQNPMATPPNAGAVNAGTASLAQLCAFAYAIYSEMQGRGMMT